MEKLSPKVTDEGAFLRFFDYANAPLRMTGSVCHSEPVEESLKIKKRLRAFFVMMN